MQEYLTVGSDLAAMTISSVERIGETGAKELEATADAFEAEAHAIAERLRDFAKRLRTNAKEASEQLAVFCNQGISVIETMKMLEAQVSGKELPEEDIPEFLKKPLLEEKRPPLLHTIR